MERETNDYKLSKESIDDIKQYEIELNKKKKMLEAKQTTKPIKKEDVEPFVPAVALSKPEVLYSDVVAQDSDDHKKERDIKKKEEEYKWLNDENEIAKQEEKDVATNTCVIDDSDESEEEKESLREEIIEYFHDQIEKIQEFLHESNEEKLQSVKNLSNELKSKCRESIGNLKHDFHKLTNLLFRSMTPTITNETSSNKTENIVEENPIKN